MNNNNTNMNNDKMKMICNMNNNNMNVNNDKIIQIDWNQSLFPINVLSSRLL